MAQTDLRPLFIFEMANNHMGSVEHGLKIIRAMHDVSRGFPFGFAVKLQYRDVDTFIHPAYRGRMDLKFVKRFSETRLSWDQYRALKDAITENGFLSVCTPWDEISVGKIEEHGFDFIKVPSCYFTDWPLLERVVKTNLPIIASTAGASLEDVDRVVSFFEHRNKKFCLMHCVGEYPVGDANLQLNQIDLFKRRYPRVEIGYSTHEDPANTDAVKIAIGKGATVLEKHVGVPTDTIRLNAYSATPDQVHAWLSAARQALEMCGVSDSRHQVTENERRSLRDLQRGVFAKGPIRHGDRIDTSRVFLAIPCCDGQLVANDMSKYTEFYADADLKPDEPVLFSATRRIENRELVYRAVDQVRKVLKASGAIIPTQLELEISHHYGLENFPRFGSTIITVVNREYCKRIIVLIPGQSHPEQYHRQKDETYHILYGTITLALDGAERQCHANEVVIIPRGVRHSFSTETGVVIEEISSAYSQSDSFYTDPAIERNEHRKTFVTYWMD
jgi:sialic acid synthase SpsE/mannose-6-phosphate isomerase-like protein (cupin superfamily)